MQSYNLKSLNIKCNTKKQNHLTYFAILKGLQTKMNVARALIYLLNFICTVVKFPKRVKVRAKDMQPLHFYKIAKFRQQF